MTVLRKAAARVGARVVVLAAVVAGVTTALVLIGGPAAPAPLSRAVAEPPLEGPEVSAQADASVPAFDVTMIGASPAEAPDETWGIGTADENGTGAPVLVRYAEGSGWSLGPGFQNAAGQPLTGFDADQVAGRTSLLAGQLTADGSGLLAGTAPAEGTESSSTRRQVLLVRNPGGAFEEVKLPVSGEAALAEGEALLGEERSPLIAPLEEAGGVAGALAVPVSMRSSVVEHRVLYWSGSHWTSEPIEIPEATHGSGDEGFRVLGIGASSPANAWLIAELPEGYPAGAVGLFRRVLGEGGQPTTWQPVAVHGGTGPVHTYPLTIPVPNGSPAVVEQKAFTVANARAQVLTVTGEGVWIDGERTDVHTPATMYFKPEHTPDSGRVAASWCRLREGSPAGTLPCERELPESLPGAESRSIAWATPGQEARKPFGERVITGFADGVSLRLEGDAYRRVLALGGSTGSSDVGGAYGAAFSTAHEGWLGQEFLPVHLTLDPQASRLQPWPVTFSRALVAVAPQPEAPVGALTSEALAVGDEGEVARYAPGKGWLPESLFGPGQRVEKPRLRAVAWPTASRAYAVGDEGAMWLWRSEDDLWEPDPAAPRNFRGNLLGIAFDPSEPSRGYAVGQGGVLLRYGKSWTQETLPSELAGANFTSIAFAGSEAIAAYHVLPDPSQSSYVGGLLVNEGSGWHVDAGAAAAMGQNVPWAVAGLPDGGAAFIAGGRSGQGLGGVLFERSSAGAAWQAVPTPLPGVGEPGSLALFREGGALRAIASGSVPRTYEIESPLPAPVGSPPTFIGAYPYSAGYGEGHVIRQTATGWSDEEHELNDAKEPPGSYTFYDTPHQPDPVSAVLMNESGTQGWAVGGFIDEAAHGALDTADIERYPAESSAPPGEGTAPISSGAANATFAIGGNAQCAAPCADSAKAKTGPDVWLSSALKRASEVAGARAFLYTGPRLSTGETTASATVAFPFARELDRYDELLSDSPIPAFAAIAPEELNNHPAREGDEQTFEEAFTERPAPVGTERPSPGLTPVAGDLSAAQRGQCDVTDGQQCAYYAFDSEGAAGTVRVVVLDDSGEVDAGQRSWLAEQLQAARTAQTPAIVVGNADLAAQIRGGGEAAKKVAQILVSGSEEGGSGCPATALRASASAYFYDSPEEDVHGTLAACGESIPTFGSGTLGYVRYTAESSGDFIGASGFLLGEVKMATRSRETNRAEVEVHLIPNIEELALEAKRGTLLRRSEVASFAGLARRPRAGNRSVNEERSPDTGAYIPIPARCLGVKCPEGILPEYSFSSSKPDIGNFVQRDEHSAEADAIELNSKGEAIQENPEHSRSDLFCAYNKGTTVVSIKAGGLSSSLTVTVQAGSVRRPCGTVPLTEPQIRPKLLHLEQPPPVAEQPKPAATPPIVVLPPAAPTPEVPRPPVHPARAFFVPAIPPSVIFAFVPPPLPTPARPTPPSGTSAVTSPVEAVEREEESEEAIESVGNQAVAYNSSEHELPPEYILGLVVLAAFAGATIARRRPRGGRRLPVATATVSEQERPWRRGAPGSRDPWRR